MAEPIRLVRDGRLAELVLDRPPLNVLDLDTLRLLRRQLDELVLDDALQALFLRSAGGRAFCAGTAVEDHTAERAPRMLAEFHRALRALRRLPAVSIAVVQGHCLGGGMELAMSCDLVLAADDSRFGQPEVDLGCFPPAAAALLPARLGSARALELLLSGRILSAADAEQLRLVTWRVPAERLDQRVREIGERLAAKSAAVTRIIKQAVRAGDGLPFEQALEETERLYRDQLLATEDAREGIEAFFAKRRPSWRHR